MKKIALLGTALVFALSAGAQEIGIGIHGGFGNTWLFNNNISDQGPELDEVASFAPIFGIHAQYGVSSQLTLRVEANYAPVKQKYKGTTTGFSYTGKDQVNYLSIPILVRLGRPTGFYFEVGPQFSFLTGAKGEASTTPSIGSDYSGRDIKTSFKSFVFSGALGLGGNINITENLLFNVGLRFAYGFTDATKQFSTTELQAMQVAGHSSITSNYAHTTQNGSFAYKPTHFATGYLLLGFSYRIPGGK